MKDLLFAFEYDGDLSIRLRAAEGLSKHPERANEIIEQLAPLVRFTTKPVELAAYKTALEKLPGAREALYKEMAKASTPEQQISVGYLLPRQ